jgi:holin-like protein
MINTLATLLIFQILGETLGHALSLPIPGPVIGMLLLFLFLIVKDDAAQKLAPTAQNLLRHMSILFVPAGVGVMLHGHRIATEWLPITVSLLVSTVLAIIVTALVVRALYK